jgi:membrane protease YdiL (CAAX protease family)
MVWFFSLTFALTWAMWYVASSGGRFPSGIGGAVFLIGVFAPAIVALGLTARATGRAGVMRLLARISPASLDLRWYVFALAYMPVLKLSAAAISRARYGTWPAFGDTPWVLMIAAIMVSTWVQAGEEIGWRGYALPRLASRVGVAMASVILGVIWSVWHLPLFFIQGSGSDGQSFPIYLLTVTAMSVAMAWLFWRTAGNLFVVMLMHAAINNTSGIVPARLAGAVQPFAFDGTPVAWWTVVLAWVVAVPLLASMRRAKIAAVEDTPLPTLTAFEAER